MINQMLDALQNKSARVDYNKDHFGIVYYIDFKSKTGNEVTCLVIPRKKVASFSIGNRITDSYIKEADLMAMIYYINEYGVAK